MKPRAFVKEAEKLEAQAMKLGNQGKRGNPDSTPNDPREIAADLRILKAKQKLVRLEGKQGNPIPLKGYITHTYSVQDEYDKELKSFNGLAPAKKFASQQAKWGGAYIWIYKVSHGVHSESGKMSHYQEMVAKFFPDGALMPKGKWRSGEGQGRLLNPSSLSSSQSLFESFHGREADGEDDVVSFENIPDHLTQLGELRELVVILPNNKEEITIEFPEENTSTILASAPGGTQYVLVGGDQGIDPDSLVEDFGISTDEIGDEWQRKVVLGEVVSLTYFTDKHHLSGPKYQKDGCLYEHELGEEGGELPTLVYDPNNESLEIVGGSYITKEEGIRN
jgi:hypothetical protein